MAISLTQLTPKRLTLLSPIGNGRGVPSGALMGKRWQYGGGAQRLERPTYAINYIINNYPCPCAGNRVARRGKNKTMMNKEKWKMILQMVLSVLTAIATTLGMGSCM